MGVPTDPLTLMINCYKKVFPIVHNELYEWKNRAKAMPDEELRQQALTSIETKQFHSEGGAILSLLAGEHYEDIVSFIVAYQTISDYLDNLCDRSTSQSSLDFRTLHQAMNDALTVGVKPENYYRFRDEQEDGGYLAALVQRCQQVLARVPHYDLIKDELIELCQIYCDLQVHKHVKLDERETRLKTGFKFIGSSILI